jgi:hypothetical protein
VVEEARLLRQVDVKVVLDIVPHGPPRRVNFDTWAEDAGAVPVYPRDRIFEADCFALAARSA